MPRSSRQYQLTHALEATRETINAQKRKLASLQSAQRDEQRKARDKRRYQVGTLVDDAGLAGLDDTVLRSLFGLLASLTTAPDPVALLKALLEDLRGTPGTSVAASGHRGDGVSAAH